jgi:hypothetical protein
MKLKVILAAFALIGAGAMVATSADAQTAQTKKKTVVYNRDRTVIVSRDEDGRTRTRIIIQSGPILIPARRASRANEVTTSTRNCQTSAPGA